MEIIERGRDIEDPVGRVRSAPEQDHERNDEDYEARNLNIKRRGKNPAFPSVPSQVCLLMFPSHSFAPSFPIPPRGGGGGDGRRGGGMLHGAAFVRRRFSNRDRSLL